MNKNRNFCIDFLYYRYLKPIIFNSEHINMLEIKGAEMLDYDDFKYKEPFSTSYCCEDCDGPWEDIVHNQYQIYLKISETKMVM